MSEDDIKEEIRKAYSKTYPNVILHLTQALEEKDNQIENIINMAEELGDHVCSDEFDGIKDFDGWTKLKKEYKVGE